MSAAELHLYYQTFHDSVQDWLDKGVPIQDALSAAASECGVSTTTVRRAYYHIRNTTRHHPDNVTHILAQGVRDNSVEMGMLINLDEARKRRRPKRMVRL